MVLWVSMTVPAPHLVFCEIILVHGEEGYLVIASRMEEETPYSTLADMDGMFVCFFPLWCLAGVGRLSKSFLCCYSALLLFLWLGKGGFSWDFFFFLSALGSVSKPWLL